MTAVVLRPARFPISTMADASALESSSVFIKAPLPVLTSRTMESAPDAIFLLIMLEAIRDIWSTVAVTSRNA